MGVSVREKPKGSGKFYIFVRHAGERTAFKYDSEDEAQAVAHAFRQKLALGELDLAAIKERRETAEHEKPAPTLNEYYERFTRVYLETSVRQGTRDRYCQIEALRQTLKRVGAPKTLQVVQNADHQFQVPKRAGRSGEHVAAELLEGIDRWCTKVLSA